MPTTNITTNFTIFADETYSGDPAFNWEAGGFGGGVTVLNLGHITSGSMAFDTWNGFGLLDNRGDIIVNRTGPGTAYGVYSPTWGPSVLNSGLFSVTGVDAAVGIQTWSPDVVITNNGQWHVSAGNYAAGIWSNNPANVVNNGEIIVSGANATGIEILRFDYNVLTNNGIITVSGATGVGLSLTGLTSSPSAATIVNTGTITAAVAIECWNQFSPVQEKIDWLLNTGTINGIIDLGHGNDIIDNRAVINGDVLMYFGNDLVDNILGTINGAIFLEDGDDEFRGGVQGSLVFGGLGNDTFHGGAGDDEFYGENAVDVLNGGGGNDILSAGSAPDTLNGGEGDDILEGGSGVDSLDGGAGFDMASYLGSLVGVNVNLETGAASGGDAQGDTFISIEDLEGSNLIDTLTGNADGNFLFGLDGNDILTGLVGDDFLYGGAGDDLLSGGADADVLTGGAGNDTYIVDIEIATLVELAGEGTDLVQSSVTWALGEELENLTLIGAAAINGSGNELANVLLGNNALNELFGNGGNDSLDGGIGADRMFGGAGNDTYVVDNTGDVTFEGSALDGVDIVLSSVARTLGANLENLTLTGAAAITGNGNSLNNTILGNTAANTLFGQGGDDALNGAGGNDILHGGAGVDSLDGGLGADTAYGGAGNDSYFVDSGGDITFEGSALDGVDTVFSSVTRALGPNLENLTLTGAAAINGGGNGLDNIINGNSGINALFGNGGNDTLNGGLGADKMYGSAGDDTYVVDNVGDVTFEGSALDGVDTVLSSVTRSLGANLENLTLTGSATIHGVGNSLGNAITGNSGANQLFGNLGDDVLNGGAGNDILNGAGGNDRFVFQPGSGSDTVNNFFAGGTDDSLDFSAYSGTGITWTITQVGANTVFDFSNGDQITLTNVIAANLVQTDPFGFG